MKDLIQQLKNYHSTDLQEIKFQKAMLKLLEDHKEISFLRSKVDAHFTASAWILNHNKSEVLLVKHRKLNKWLQPGGHADGQTDLLDVALKEAAEETGLQDLIILKTGIFDIDIHRIPQNSKGVAEHDHYDVRYAFICKDEESVVINHESTAFKWIKLEEITRFTDNASILRMALKCKDL